ncbi:MAG: acyl-CoA desaturase [Bacteroidetes bacterium]|nr:MAG: acyl-CoA desaturase [Bacteroidota bacterium]
MVIFLFFIIHWYSSLFFQTFFHHRYAAHKMFSMSPFWEKVFYLGSFIFQGSSYLSPYAYAVLHRMHHAYADTEKDPHSPSYDDNLFAMMWRTRKVYNDIYFRRANIEPRFTKDVPDWTRFDQFASARITRLGWIAAYVAFYALFATSWWMFLLIPIHAVIGPVHGVIINWFAHRYGYINFPTTDTSKNLMPFDVFMLGEGYHNNHHKFGGRANFGVKWYEIDPVYPVIRLFDKLRIIRLNRSLAPA